MAYYCRAEQSYQFGVVVRSFLPERNALLILIPGVGVLYVVFACAPKCLFFVGTVIRFLLHAKSSGSHVISSVSFEQKPTDWVEKDLLFVHHLCELCQRFVFSAEDASSVFALMQDLYKPLHLGEDVESKKLSILSRFFLVLGHYVPPTFSLDAFTGKALETVLARDEKKQIKQWLCACICLCEPAYALKTIHFLTT